MSRIYFYKSLAIVGWAVIISALSNCATNNDLQKSVFVSDRNDPELPVYSEFGYNTFGFYYDRSSVVSNNFEVPMKVVNDNSTTGLTFTGQRDGYDHIFSIKFSIQGLDPQDYSDLISLNNSTWDLTSQSVQIEIKDGSAINQVSVISGQLVIKKARSVKIDDQLKEVTLSGTFEFQALIDSLPVTISSGRFDIGVGVTNFYKY